MTIEANADRTAFFDHKAWAESVRIYRASLDLYQKAIAMRAKGKVTTMTQLIAAQSVAPRGGEIAAATSRPVLAELTQREREVAELVADGYSNQQIADRLVLTRGTVANHVAHILYKLGVTNRTQVAALVHQRSVNRT